MDFLAPIMQQVLPYTPGEQPQTNDFIKLNTNENPYPPAPTVLKAISKAADHLQRYPDPTASQLVKRLATYLGVESDEVFVGNGSDEVLAFCFQGLMGKGVAFPDITYGFYPVFSQLYQVPTRVIPLQADLTIALADYTDLTETVIFANPNAPTGKSLTAAEILAFVRTDTRRLVIVDEAYVEFGGESLVPYVSQLENLLVVGTFSKAWQLAGARLGYAVGSRKLIRELNKLKFSFNPYSINGMTMAAGNAALEALSYHQEKLTAVIKTRQWTLTKLRELGFEVADSQTNFLFPKHSEIKGELFYQELKQRKILVRWFSQERIKNHLRITIGTPAEMAALIETLQAIIYQQNEEAFK